MEYDNDSGDFLGNWPISKAERDARLRRRRIIRRVVRFCVLGVVLSAMVWAAFQVDWRAAGRNAGPIAGSAWRASREWGAKSWDWARSACASVSEWFRGDSTEVADSELAHAQYNDFHRVYWEELTDAVKSERSRGENSRVLELDRDLAIGMLKRLHAIAHESECLPKHDGSPDDYEKLLSLSARLKDYTAYRHGLATGRRPFGLSVKLWFFSFVRWLQSDGGLFVFAFVAYCIVCYCKAYALVSSGRITVYADWPDFLRSLAWAVLLPAGFGGLYSNDLGIVWGILCFAAVAVGLWSVWQLFAGAFRYNSSRSCCWIALGARLAVAMLALFAVAKLTEKIRAYRRRELGLVRGVMIPLALFALVYHYGVRPMIGRRS